MSSVSLTSSAVSSEMTPVQCTGSPMSGCSSNTMTSRPASAQRAATNKPAGPPPTTATSVGVALEGAPSPGEPRTLHRRGHAAVEINGSPRDVGCALGGEEGDEVRELLGLADAAERNAPRDVPIVRVQVTFRATLPLRALHETEAHGVHENVVDGVLVGERLRQVDAGGARDARRQ